MHASTRPIWLFCAVLVCHAAVAAVEGNPDPSFNGGAVRAVSVPFNDNTDVTPLLIGFSTLSNGYLAAISHGPYGAQTVELVKILKDGTLAQNFGVGGVRDLTEAQIAWSAMTTTPGPDTITLAGSKIVGSSNSTYSFHIERRDAFGTLDSTFNGNLGYNDITPGYQGGGAYDQVGAITVLPSTGQTLVAGTGYAQDAGGLGLGMGVVRLNGNGTTDTSFGSNGGVTYEFPLNGGNSAKALAIAVDSQARILLGGYATVGTGTTAHSDFAVVRFTSTGVVDSCTAQSITQPCAYSHAFHLGGKFNDAASDLRLEQTGKIYLVGNSSAGTDGLGNDLQKNSILRLTDQFQLDTSYNPTAGSESFFMEGTSGENDAAPSAVVDAKNRLMVSGGHANLDVARFVPSGAYDSYGAGGEVVAIVDSSNGGAHGPWIQPRIVLDGDRPVVAELTIDDSAINLRVLRLLGDRIFASGFQ